MGRKRKPAAEVRATRQAAASIRWARTTAAERTAIMEAIRSKRKGGKGAAAKKTAKRSGRRAAFVKVE